MSYTKFHENWGPGDSVPTTALTNFETVYTEASSYLSGHTHDATFYTKAQAESAFIYTGNDGSGSGVDVDLLYHASGNLHASSFEGLGVPPGIIIMWSGATVPTGWHLCDGTDGYIDLRDRFIYGAGEIAVGTNGSGSHTPTGSISVSGHALTTGEVRGHQHSYTDRYSNPYGAESTEAGQFLVWTGTHSEASPVTGNSDIGKTPADAHGHSTAEGSAFTGNAFTAAPPFYALAFLQKI